MIPRGIRLNNPGNIRISAAHWFGKATPSLDTEFETFDKMEHGIRAIAKILISYQDRYGLYTIRDMITRWAPPSDSNPTDAYVQNVSDRSGIDPDEKINIKKTDNQFGIIEGIIMQENGGLHDITKDQIISGINLAIT